MTAQSFEKLFYEGRETHMAAEPLNPYLRKLNNIAFVSFRTDCWRGYFGTWEIIEDKLFLTGLEGSAEITDMKAYAAEKKRLKQMLKDGLITPMDNGKMLKKIKESLTTQEEITLQTLFPGQEKVFAYWVSGHIRVPEGEMLNYVHMGYDSVYEKNLFLNFQNGILTGKTLVDNHIEDDNSDFMITR